MSNTLSKETLSNMAYEQVLLDLGLPPGTKLHEDPEYIKLWRRYFKLFSELADMPEPLEPLLEAA
jgi:hypothetical protein